MKCGVVILHDLLRNKQIDNMRKPKVSIIIATFNSEKTLHVAIDSVLNQDFQDWECIVVDGLSKDNTIKIVEEYEARDSRIRHISEKDKGIYDAFNKGWKLAKGEWIYYLGSDDMVTENGIADLIAVATLEASVVYGDMYALFEDGSERYVKARPAKQMTYIMAPSHQGMITRKSLIEAENGFDLQFKVRADFDLTQRIYLKYGNFVYTPKAITTCLQAGISSKYIFKYRLERLRLMRKNKSTRFPLFMFWRVEWKKVIKQFILKPLGLIK